MNFNGRERAYPNFGYCLRSENIYKFYVRVNKYFIITYI